MHKGGFDLKSILAISSSPRRNGNSELLLQSFAKGAEEEGCDVSLVRINELNIKPCQACDGCAATGECVQKDDMQNIYPQVASAAGIVLATPVYFGSLSAQLKAFIDRFQSWWHAKYRLNMSKVKPEEGKKAFFICVGALQKKEYCESALAVAKIFFHNINYQYKDCICQRGVDEKGAIKEYPEALQNALDAGRDFAGQTPDL